MERLTAQDTIRLSMNAIHELNRWTRFSAAVCCSIALSACFGCASYFRTGQKSYQEVDQKNQEIQKENQTPLKPSADSDAR